MKPDMNNEDQYKKISDLLEKLEALMIAYQLLDSIQNSMHSHTSMDFPKDLSFECEMCGKPMEYRYCGMCTHCEMVWNG